MKLQKHRSSFRLCLALIFLGQMQLCNHQEMVPLVYNIVPVVKDLRLQKWISQCRCIIIPVIVAATLYFNKEKVVENIVQHPMPFALISYFLGNCIIDSVSKYRQINQTLDFFLFSQAMSRYMLCMLAIKNTMLRLKVTKGIDFNEQDFDAIIIKNTGYSIAELETFTFELLSSSIHSINNLCIDMNTIDIEEKIYFLFKEQIALEQMLVVCKDDAMIYAELTKFHDHPEEEYEFVIKKFCALVHQHFNYFIQKKGSL